MPFNLSEDEWAAKQQVIKEYLANPKTTGGRDRLYEHIHEDHPDISRRMVAEVLAQDSTHQIHRPLNKRITSRPIVTRAPATVSQIDLVDMQKLAHQNGGNRYFLSYVDLFSKWVAVRTLKDKTQKRVTDALLDILNNLPPAWRPKTIQADNGAEFQKGMEAALRQRGIKMIHSAAYQPTTQGQVERLNRTLKSALFSLMTRNKTLRYIDLIPDLVDNLNNSKHGSTGFKPIDLMNGIPLPAAVIEKVHENLSKKLKHAQQADRVFAVGDLVRVALTTESSVRKNSFRKKITANWSPTVYRVYSVSQPEKQGLQPQYLLHNLTTNRNSSKRYWGYQLQPAQAPEELPPELLDHGNAEVVSQETDEIVPQEVPQAPKRPVRARVPVARVVDRHGNRVIF